MVYCQIYHSAAFHHLLSFQKLIPRVWIFEENSLHERVSHFSNPRHLIPEETSKKFFFCIETLVSLPISCLLHNDTVWGEEGKLRPLMLGFTVQLYMSREIFVFIIISSSQIVISSSKTSDIIQTFLFA